MAGFPYAATTLAEVVRTCSPKPLDGEDLRRFWVETQPARDPMLAFRINLKDLLEEPGTPAVLVFGHRGCGKSTEINKFITDLPPDRWLVVKVQCGQFLPAGGNEAADVLLAACTSLMGVVQARELDLNEDALQPVLRYFQQIEVTRQTFTAHETSGTGGLQVGGSFVGQLLGLKAGLEQDLKHGSRESTSVVGKFRQQKGQLVAAVKSLFLNAELAWRRKAAHPDARLALVVEDLDKLGLQDARRIFVEDGHLLTEVGVPAIFTIPIFAFHSPEAGAIRGYGFREIRVPMIKVVHPDGSPADEGRDAVRHIVRSRVSRSVLTDDALEVLITRTGGVLRDVFDAIQHAAQFLPVKQSGVIDLTAMTEALKRMQTTLGLRITYPPDDRGGLRDPKPLQAKLAELAKGQAKGQKFLAQADPELHLLLMSGALLEYNGDGWLGVHPLAKAYLKDLGHDVGG